MNSFQNSTQVCYAIWQTSENADVTANSHAQPRQFWKWRTRGGFAQLYTNAYYKAIIIEECCVGSEENPRSKERNSKPRNWINHKQTSHMTSGIANP